MNQGNFTYPRAQVVESLLPKMSILFRVSDNIWDHSQKNKSRQFQVPYYEGEIVLHPIAFRNIAFNECCYLISTFQAKIVHSATTLSTFSTDTLFSS